MDLLLVTAGIGVVLACVKAGERGAPLFIAAVTVLVGVADAIAAEELKFGDQVPTGTYLDMAVNLPLVDPKKVLAPVLMVRGEFDGNSTNEDLLDFYTQLVNGDRQYVILPQTAHSLGFAKNRHLLFYAVRNFLKAPAAIPAA